VTPFDQFFMAEDLHQEYFKKNPFQGYCRAIIAPKVSKFRHAFSERLKK
jgi:peptide methionine sulfoxide reductase MsrA